MLDRIRGVLGGGAMALALLTPCSTGLAQTADSVLVQIAGRVSIGDRVGAWALADSLVGVLPPTSTQHADALYWRAFTASTAADAEHDYRRLSVEYPLSSRSAEALLHLAELEYARRDRVASRRHFELLLREHPTGPHVARASYWSAQLSFEEGDAARACASLATTHDDVELVNQIDYHLGRCAAAALKDSTTRAMRDSAAGGVRDTTTSNAPPRQEFSIQIASYARKRDATALATQLRRRGFASRVAGAEPPYRVRIGRYASREEAVPVLARVRRGNPRAIIVPAESR